MPTKRLRPNTASRPDKTAACPPMTVSKATINAKPQGNVSGNRPPPLVDAPVHDSTPWPGAGKCQETSLRTETGYSLPTF